MTRIGLSISVLLLALVLSAPAIARDQSDGAASHHQTIFSVSDPPSAPFHAHQSLIRFAPGAEAPLHTHGGPGYISILQGELTLYEDDERNVYRAGDSVVETPDNQYKGGNYGEEDVILMVTYLIPDGEEVTTAVDDPDASAPPEIEPETLAEAAHAFADPPDSFDLVQSLTVVEPGDGTEPAAARGDTLLSSVSGNVRVTVNGDNDLLASGQAMLVARDREFNLVNEGENPAQVMATELVPDVHSVAPAAGSTVDRTMATWLFVMTAAALLVVGGILRLSTVRIR